jgi:small-conductance mechanosensitive channel
MNEFTLEKLDQGLQATFKDATTMRSLVVLLGAVLVAYFLSKYVARGIVRFAQLIAVRSDNTPNEVKIIQLRRVETYLSIALALVRAVIVATVAYVAWGLINTDNSHAFSAAAIGASAFFVVLASGTLGPLLRDITAGATMIIEHWFAVGDFIRVEPFMDVNGVVERVTLRSTKMRNINGEVIWLHNQHIQGVKVTPWGLRTLALDVFVRDLDAGKTLVENVSKTLQVGPTMLAKPMRIVSNEKLADNLWRITLLGQTAPGREWLIENFIADSLKQSDEKSEKPIIVYGPLVRFADEAAEKRFKRAVRVSRQTK